MHYQNNAFSSNGLPTIVAKSGMPLIDASQKAAISRGDVAALRAAYKCNH